MPWTWSKPLPLIFMAAPLILLWAPARAFIGLAAAKVPAATRSVLSHTMRRRRPSSCATAVKGQRPTCSMSAAVEAPAGCVPRKVIVIAGPTATGKSSIALGLCKVLGGEIVSCDSVQVYEDLSVGSNKPSTEEMREVRHHLVNIATLDQTFTAGEFVRRAKEAIDDIHYRGLVPVVVGGTMMYVQWLMQGTPDAPKKDQAVARAVEAELKPFKERGDWEGALHILSALSQTRADSLCRNDWYRLSRSLEVLRGAQHQREVYTGQRRALEAEYDFRSFFIVGDRERLFRRIDSRCEEMLERGLLVETADLLVNGTLDPASPAGRAIGYRQAVQFLTEDPETVDGSNYLRPAATGKVYGTDAISDGELRFLEFYRRFASRTRQYAGDQIKWYRSEKGKMFSWQAWDLGGEIEEGRRIQKNGRALGRLGSGRPAERKRAGDGLGLQDVVAAIAECYRQSADAFADGLEGEHQISLRKENEMRAKDMNYYVPLVTATSLGNKAVLRRLVQQTDELSRRVREAQREREEVGMKGRDGQRVAGWQAGCR